MQNWARSVDANPPAMRRANMLFMIDFSGMSRSVISAPIVLSASPERFKPSRHPEIPRSLQQLARSGFLTGSQDEGGEKCAEPVSKPALAFNDLNESQTPAEDLPQNQSYSAFYRSEEHTSELQSH